MKRYGKIYAAFFRASLTADIEFRANFFTRILTDIFWYAAQIITFEALFTVTPKLGDWSLEQTRVFLGLIFVVDAFYMIIFQENLDRINERVRMGQMDLILAKPINSQFMISCEKLNTAIFGNLLLALSWLFFSLYNLADFSWLRLIWLVFLIPAGVIVLYSTRFMFSSCAVIFTRAENLQYLWYQIYRLGMRPDSIYAPWLKYLVLTLLPMGIIASVPARFLLNPPNLGLFGWAIFMAFFVLYLSNKFWRYALKQYSSASS